MVDKQSSAHTRTQYNITVHMCNLERILKYTSNGFAPLSMLSNPIVEFV
jgi:hypothetical protein